MANLSVLGCPLRPWPTSLVDARNSGDEKRIRSTSVHLPLTRKTVHCRQARVCFPASSVLLDQVWSGMDEGMISAVRRDLTEGGGVGGGQAAVVITHGMRKLGEKLRQFRIYTTSQKRMSHAHVVVKNSN